MVFVHLPEKNDSYAEKIEIMLGCKARADALHGEYLEFAENHGGRPNNNPRTIAMIRHFLREKNLSVDLQGIKTPKGGSTCLEITVAGLLLLKREKVPAKVELLFFSNKFSLLHYRLLDESNRAFEFYGLKGRLRHGRQVPSWKLGPESVVRHMHVIDRPLKILHWKSLTPSTKIVRTQQRAALAHRAVPL